MHGFSHSQGNYSLEIVLTMSRKQKSKREGTFSFPLPSISWLPAFFAGLCVGILIHLIPGMDTILGEARRAEQEQTSPQPIMWRPQTTKPPYR